MWQEDMVFFLQFNAFRPQTVNRQTNTLADKQTGLQADSAAEPARTKRQAVKSSTFNLSLFVASTWNFLKLAIKSTIKATQREAKDEKPTNRTGGRRMELP